MRHAFVASCCPLANDPWTGQGQVGIPPDELVGLFARLSAGRYRLTLPTSPSHVPLFVRVPGATPGSARLEITRLGPRQWAVEFDRVTIPEHGRASSDPIDVDSFEALLTWDDEDRAWRPVDDGRGWLRQWEDENDALGCKGSAAPLRVTTRNR